VHHVAGSSVEPAVFRSRRPDNEIPVSVPIDVLLARTDDLAVAITGARAFTTGLDFTLAVRSRAARRDGLIDDLGGHRPPGTDRSRHFLLGFEFADGRTVTNVDTWPPPVDSDVPTLVPGSGGASTRFADHDFFLSPIPPPGDLIVVCAWPAADVPETRTVLDAGAIVDAARRVIVLWPEPVDEPPLPPVEPPPVPPGGWFERAVGRRR